ncbi:class I SAM-dependent methyltransferase [Ilyomonas limi]|uniref:Class I SAM-dependent methyltransferase n=2 Tax=Ilyomonas limi TaxID=2575867 RepID=A0A4U3L8D4_9BACT|nr:class I SAM-dependent methyltransferase [Ilyomonas limi]
MCFCFGKCQSQTQQATDKIKSSAVYTYATPSPDGTGKFYYGREIAQVMGAAGASWLERSERQQEENTAFAVNKMNLQDSDVVADVGAGTGYYTFKIAAKVPRGKVYAVDIQDEMLRLLRERKQKEKAANVIVVKGTDTTTNLPPDSIDLAIMVDVYHELQHPQEILQSLRQALTSKGKLLLIEYRGEDTVLAIKPLHKTTVAQLNKEMAVNGFTLSYQGEFLPIQHFLLYSKTKVVNP